MIDFDNRAGSKEFPSIPPVTRCAITMTLDADRWGEL